MQRGEQATHVRWADVESEAVRPGVRRRGVTSRDALVVRNELDPGMEPRPHSHPEDQIALVLHGTVRFTVGDEQFDVGAGELLVIPGGVEHHGIALGDETAINVDVFAPPRADYAHLVAWQGRRHA